MKGGSVSWLLAVWAACHVQGAFEDDGELEVGVDGQPSDFSEVPITPPELTSYIIEHSLTADEQFSQRGVLEVQTNTMTRQRSVRVSPASVQPLASVEMTALQQLVATNGLYRIRVRSSATNESAPFVMSALRICELVESSFKDDLKLLLDAEGSLISVEYRAPKSVTSQLGMKRDCHGEGAIPATVKFMSRASLVPSTPAQQIPLQPPPILKPPPGMQAVSAGPGGKPVPGQEGQQPQQSFLRKYWYIILPIAVMMLRGEPPAEGGQGGSAGGGGARSGGGGRQ